MREVGLALPNELADRIAGDLIRNGYLVAFRADDAAELEQAVGDAGTEIVIVGAGEEYLTSAVLGSCDDSGVRIIAMARSDAERRNAAQLGLREVLPADADWSELASALDAGPSFGTVNNAGSTDEHRRGRVVAVWGPAGAPGRTTLAIAVAAELAAEGYSVALADADTHSGSVAPALGLLDEAPGFAAACRLAGADSLTTSELERVGQRYLSAHGSFWVLSGIGRPSRWPELSADRISTVLGTCRDWVDFTVVDTGFSLENDEEISSDLFAPRRNAATISSLRAADLVIAVGSADPVGLSRFLRAHVDLLEVVDAERIVVVMNKIRASAIGLNPSAQVEQTLRRFGGITAAMLIPHDQPALDAAILGGKSLRDVAAKSPARIAVSRVVSARLLDGEPGRAGQPGREGQRGRDGEHSRDRKQGRDPARKRIPRVSRRGG